jgi:hypothetical protein
VQSITRHGINLTPEQFKERFDMLQQVTEAGDAKQRAALVHRLRQWPDPLELLPTTVQGKAVALKQQLLQQLIVDEEQTQQLIGKVPTVLMYKADLLVDKASEQGPLLDIKAAYVVVQLWTHNHHLVTASTQLLHKKLVQLQLLLQPYMSSADVRQLVLSQPRIVAGSSTDAVQARLEALQECLPDWTPQQLGAALRRYAALLTLSPDTIRYKWRIASQYSHMYVLGTRQQQEQQQEQEQQQQQQLNQASVLGLFKAAAERYALLIYTMMQQQQQQQQSESSLNSTGSSGSNSSQCLESSSDDEEHSVYMPPMLKSSRVVSACTSACCRSTTQISGSGTCSGSRQQSSKGSSQSSTPCCSTSWSSSRNSSSRKARAAPF